ncbi:MAG: hypothetical protein V4739_14025 [Pseudomonadota bacterium]
MSSTTLNSSRTDLSVTPVDAIEPVQPVDAMADPADLGLPFQELVQQQGDPLVPPPDVVPQPIGPDATPPPSPPESPAAPAPEMPFAPLAPDLQPGSTPPEFDTLPTPE